MATKPLPNRNRPVITPPADAPMLVQRMQSARREGFQAKRVDSPEGSQVWRVSWVETQIAGGRSGGYARDVEVVRWMAWADGEYLGSVDTKRQALADVDWFQSREA